MWDWPPCPYPGNVLKPQIMVLYEIKDNNMWWTRFVRKIGGVK